jgi:hypothetical protein
MNATGFCNSGRRPASYIYVPTDDATKQKDAEMACNRVAGHLASFHSQSDIDKALTEMKGVHLPSPALCQIFSIVSN